jgi:hypothetical protein
MEHGEDKMTEYYYIWVKDSNGNCRHGLKPVTQERGEKLIARYDKSWPENRYWLEPVEPPHTEAMRKKSDELWKKALRLADCINADPAEIMFICDCAANLERYALQPVVFALPLGECDCVADEQACIYC